MNTTDAFQSPLIKAEERLSALDGLRGIAILMVLVWHYYACVPRPDWAAHIPLLERVTGYGWAGVQLFFTLSGFLIGRILIAHRGQSGYYRVFYFRRAARLLPLYFMSLGLYAVALVTLPPSEHLDLSALLNASPPYWVYPLFLQNFVIAKTGYFGGSWLGVTWSLAVEEQFYLLLPIVIAILKPAHVARLMCALVVFGGLFRFFVLKYSLADPVALIVLLPGRIDAFALGILAGINFKHVVPLSLVRWATIVGILGCICAVEYGKHLTNSLDALSAYRAIAYVLISVIFALVLWHIRNAPNGHLSRCLSIRPLVWMGSASYFVYLFHQPANHLLHYAIKRQTPNLLTLGSFTITVGSLSLVLLLAFLSRRYLEEPMIQLGKTHRYGAGGK